MWKPVLKVTITLVFGGGLAASLSAALAMEIATLLLMHTFAPTLFIVASGVIGAALGAVGAPALTWAFLRNVTIGRALISIAISSGVGAVPGLLVGAPHINPYARLDIYSAPVPQGILGALAGTIVVA